jgi:ribose transport system ATP-binding protein
MSVALAVNEVSKAYGPTQALDRASLIVQRGSIHALLGGNGSGKSTLIKILAGVVKADGGTVSIGGRTLSASSLTPGLASEARCFFVHQDSGVFPELSIVDNLHLGRGFQPTRMGRIRWRSLRCEAEDVLRRYDIDADPRTLVSELSPATQTKVAIARALGSQEGASEGVLILDEPTASLPADEVRHLLHALRRYADAGQAIVFVTHRLAEVCEIADSATVLRNGQVIATLMREGISQESLTELIAGPIMSATEDRARPTAVSPVLLAVQGLSGDDIDGLSFDLRKGEILGLAGLIGSGCGTVLKLLFALVARRAGTVALSGERLRLRSPRDAMAAGLAYVPADRKRDGAFADLTVSENLAMAVVPSYWRRGVLRRGDERHDSRTILLREGIKAQSEQVPLSALSGGNQQKVVLARWLRRQPKVLLLEEPTQGVDVGARAAIHDAIRQVVAHGVGAIVSSSDEEELAAVCDRVIVLRQDGSVGTLDGDEINADRIAREAHANRVVV